MKLSFKNIRIVLESRYCHQDIMIRDEVSFFCDQNSAQNVTSFNLYNKQLTTQFCKKVS